MDQGRKGRKGRQRDGFVGLSCTSDEGLDRQKRHGSWIKESEKAERQVCRPVVHEIGRFRQAEGGFNVMFSTNEEGLGKLKRQSRGGRQTGRQACMVVGYERGRLRQGECVGPGIGRRQRVDL